MAPSVPVLVAARAVQAVRAALLVPAPLALLLPECAVRMACIPRKSRSRLPVNYTLRLAAVGHGASVVDAYNDPS